GYVNISRSWQKNDVVVLNLNIKPQRIYANTKVRANAGNVALMYGPLVYCFEECDNGADLSALRLPRDSEIRFVKKHVNQIGEIVVLETEGLRAKSSDALYSSTPPSKEKTTLTAIPYYTWGNRCQGGMRVWLIE
ncbi:MAG: glycoside hydrolase family 127 protein, partial [Oscillospiraceae bacterium]|nr:glycoside hydrolase family 127 protein [Oscillospiraceae bacterium]